MSRRTKTQRELDDLYNELLLKFADFFVHPHLTPEEYLELQNWLKLIDPENARKDCDELTNIFMRNFSFDM
jgi:hypothetical protein